MPLYDYVCDKNSEHVLIILERYADEVHGLPCHEKVDCGGVLIRQTGANSKAFVRDIDLIKARTHYGKDK